MNIEKALKNYNENKGRIEAAQARCDLWQYCLDTMTDEQIALEFIYTEGDTYGMPRARTNESPVEKEVVRHEVTREMVKRWIKDDESRMVPVKYEIKLIDIGLGSLTEEENYVIKCKCVEGWNYKQVEISFNNEFRNEDKITTERLKKIKKQALKKMEKVINSKST